MKVWRLENSDAVGPYFGAGHGKWTERFHVDPLVHPAPWQDGNLKAKWSEIDSLSINEKKLYVCGFESLDKLNAWFNKEELSNLFRLGFVIKEFEVKEEFVWKGDIQLMFRRDYPACYQIDYEEVCF